MGFGSEGSLVLKHHEHKKHFSNKDLEVLHMYLLLHHHFWPNVSQKLFEEAAERKKRPFTIPDQGDQTKQVTTLSGLQIIPANRNVSDIVKLMDTSHTGYLTVMVITSCHFSNWISFSGDKVVFTSSVPIFWYIQRKIREKWTYIKTLTKKH